MNTLLNVCPIIYILKKLKRIGQDKGICLLKYTYNTLYLNETNFLRIMVKDSKVTFLFIFTQTL